MGRGGWRWSVCRIGGLSTGHGGRVIITDTPLIHRPVLTTYRQIKQGRNHPCAAEEGLQTTRKESSCSTISNILLKLLFTFWPAKPSNTQWSNKNPSIFSHIWSSLNWWRICLCFTLELKPRPKSQSKDLPSCKRLDSNPYGTFQPPGLFEVEKCSWLQARHLSRGMKKHKSAIDLCEENTDRNCSIQPW